ncbi:M48 family metalloprotease [Streptomyces sp. NPDC012888]|uniref:M48 family metalloprotease n=1 Tax=Streptomyces sp. NPDC012888 TaxID=3364855 RepID=UPI003689EB34
MAPSPLPVPDPVGPADDLVYRHAPGTRVHYTARQRSADLTTVGLLLLQLPSVALGLGLVLVPYRLLLDETGLPYAVPAGLWLAAGLLAFHRRTEDLVARYLLRLHHPTPGELAVLVPVWREVTARAGVEPGRYRLWIEDSERLDAAAVGTHLVVVTRRALDTLPTSQLAAVLARQLSHHTAGHTWAILLGWWYALPGRLAWRCVRRLAGSALRAAKRLSVPAALLLFAVSLWGTYRLAHLTYGLPLLLVPLPLLVAAAARRSEFRADRRAVALGFGPALGDLLQAQSSNDGRSDDREKLRRNEKRNRRREDRDGRAGALRRLLAPMPDARTRLHRLGRS